jgi:RNA polymerase sigma factor (sigma-70 family)
MERGPGAVLDELRVVLARGGSSAAFGQLVVRWSPGLHRHARRLLRDSERAADVVQDAWLNIARGLGRLDDPARFAAWAFAIVTRRCVDAMRRGLRERRLTAAAVNEAAVAASDDSTTAADARLDLAAAISRLPLDQRLLVSLHYGEGLGVDEIAAAHGVPPGTVKSRLYAARQALRTYLEGADDDQS